MQVRGQSASRYPHYQRTQLQGTGCLFPRLPACLPACLPVGLFVCLCVWHPLDYLFSPCVCVFLRVSAWASAGLSVQSVCVSGHPLDYLFSLCVFFRVSGHPLDCLFSLCISPCICTSAGLSVQSVCVYFSVCLGIRRTISLICLCVVLRRNICSYWCVCLLVCLHVSTFSQSLCLFVCLLI